MGMSAIKVKIMPSSPESNLEEIKEKARQEIEKQEGKNVNFEEEPIAFGLKAVMASFACDENKETESLEKELNNIPNVSSAQIVDIRRML